MCRSVLCLQVQREINRTILWANVLQMFKFGENMQSMLKPWAALLYLCYPTLIFFQTSGKENKQANCGYGFSDFPGIKRLVKYCNTPLCEWGEIWLFFFLLLLFLITDHFIGLVNRLLDITPLPFLCYLSPFHIYSVNLVGSLTVSSQWKMVGFAFWSWLRDTRDSGVKSTDGLASIYWQTYSLSIATVSASV